MQGSVLISSRKSVVGKSWKDSHLEYRTAVQHSGWEYWLQCQRPGFKSYFYSLTARYWGYNSEEGKLLGPIPILWMGQREVRNVYIIHLIFVMSP